jgi:fengycin family lipopeptide synthetase D
MSKKSIYYDPGLTLPAMLRRATESPNELHIGYYDKNNNLTTQTYRELQAESMRVAAGLHKLGCKQGDKLIIASRNNRETIEVLWGAFQLGLVPTVLQPPSNFSDGSPPLVKLMKVFELMDAPYVFISRGLEDTGGLLEGKIKHKDDLDVSGSFPEPVLRPGDLSFIQFSSGSTGDPKGVMLTQGNLMVNMDDIGNGTDTHYPDSWGNWMPLYHDMGLIGYHLQPILRMVSNYQIETLDFIMNPGTWLNLMGREKFTVGGTTTFGLALALKYIARGKHETDWDFSRMKALLNGAEPISVKTMEDFISALLPFGFRPEAMMPVYGMAEATLAISFAPLLKRSVSTAFDSSLLDRENKAVPTDPGDPSARLISEVGVSLNDIDIRITGDDDLEVPEGISGHIQIKGPSITQGYYRNPEATAAAFCGEWFRTGDIGFFYDGRLHISGRSKDIIFKNGIHYFANDLEELACSMDEIKQGKVCLGGTTDNHTSEEKIIAFIAGLPETKAPDIFREFRSLLRSRLGLSVDELVLLKSNEIPKTSSGKMQRYKLMQRYLGGDFAGRILKPERGDYL